jgi:hypothetical protein
VHTLRVQNQAKWATHSGPSLALAFPRDNHSVTRDPTQENNQGTPGRTQVPQANPLAIRLYNLDKKRDREKAIDHMGVKICKKQT